MGCSTTSPPFARSMSNDNVSSPCSNNRSSRQNRSSRRKSANDLTLGDESPWQNRKSAMCRRVKTAPIPAFDSTSDDSSPSRSPAGRHNSWEQRRSALIRTSSGQSPRRSPRVRRTARSTSLRKKKPERPTLGRWDSEPALKKNPSEGASKDADASKMCRWESSPGRSPQARRPIRRGDSTCPATTSPRRPRRQISISKDPMPRAFGRPIQPALDFEGRKTDCGGALEQLKQKMKGFNTAA